MVIEFKLGLEVQEFNECIFIVYHSPRGKFLINAGWCFLDSEIRFPEIGTDYIFRHKDYPEINDSTLTLSSTWTYAPQPFTEIGKWWLCHTERASKWKVLPFHNDIILEHTVKELPTIIRLIDEHLRYQGRI